MVQTVSTILVQHQAIPRVEAVKGAVHAVLFHREELEGETDLSTLLGRPSRWQEDAVDTSEVVAIVEREVVAADHSTEIVVAVVGPVTVNARACGER